MNKGILWCIDEDYKIFGDYDAIKFSNLMVAFDRCNVTENSQCVTDDEAKSALELSYINTFENRETFVHYEKPTSGKAITKETMISWFPITTTTRTDSVKKVTVTEV